MNEITIHVNGVLHRLTVDPPTSLLDLLRERFGLTGSNKGCDHGQCGACTVLIDGRRANACLALAVAHDGGAVYHAAGRRTRRGGTERVHVVASADVGALDDVGVINLIRGAFVDSLVPDAVGGSLLELVEHRPVTALGAVDTR